MTISPTEVTSETLTLYALTGAGLVAGICLLLGAVLIAGGAWLGTRTRRSPEADEARTKVDQARGEVAAADQRIGAALEGLQGLGQGGLEGFGPASAAPSAAQVAAAASGAARATAAAASSNATARSALEQVSGIVGALPVQHRFAGMLVLVGAVLVSVATVQYGGTSLF